MPLNIIKILELTVRVVNRISGGFFFFHNEKSIFEKLVCSQILNLFLEPVDVLRLLYFVLWFFLVS